MTNQQQPSTAPERIYTHPTSAEIHLTRSPLEPDEYIEYARVQPVDEGRVREIRERRTKAAALEARRGYSHPLERPTWADVDYLLSLLPQLSSSKKGESDE